MDEPSTAADEGLAAPRPELGCHDLVAFLADARGAQLHEAAAKVGVSQSA